MSLTKGSIFLVPICTGNNLKLYAWEFLYGKNILNYAYVGNINKMLINFLPSQRGTSSNSKREKEDSRLE